MTFKDLFKHNVSNEERCRRNGRLDHVTFREITLWVLQAVFMVILAYSAYQLWWPVEILRIDSVKVFQTEIKRGDLLTFQFTGEKLLPLPVHANIELINGERIAIMAYTSNNPVGTVFSRRSFIVPYHILPGRYQIKWTGVYEVNALRTITLTTKSEGITIK
jgi:hypothetical protein